MKQLNIGPGEQKMLTEPLLMMNVNADSAHFNHDKIQISKQHQLICCRA